jgi:hypothetical protein
MRLYLTKAQVAVLAACGELVLAGEWPDDIGHERDVLEAALNRIAQQRPDERTTTDPA